MASIVENKNVIGEKTDEDNNNDDSTNNPNDNSITKTRKNSLSNGTDKKSQIHEYLDIYSSIRSSQYLLNTHYTISRFIS